MCGIAGARGPVREDVERAVEAMCVHMVPRGPDEGDLATFDWGGRTLALGSRRLSIIDLSPAGHQPMTDDDRGTTIVFNGMIYNFEELRRRLEAEGERFVSHCDTEVVLRAYGRFGEDCVRHLRGMFAFAIWDARSSQLFLARDRLGIKPLYYRHGPRGQFLFASQVKSLVASGLVPVRLAPEAIRTFLDYGAVSDPLTALEGVCALPAGHTAVLGDGDLRVSRYWSFPGTSDLELQRGEARERLRELLVEAVRQHLVSDAPLGLFLSGGIDSSTLAGLAARETSHLRTVSIVFDDPAFSEEPYIDAVVRSLGSQHVRIELTATDLLDSFGAAFEAMDQPSFDGINTYAVSRAASETGLRVALSGLGGDELFDGYGQLRRVRRLELARRMPKPLRLAAARAANARLTGAPAAKSAAWLADGAFGRGSSYELLRRLFLPGEVLRLLPGARPDNRLAPQSVNGHRDLYAQVSELELTNYTRNVLLRDTDAMSMANSLEVRVPFLDSELVEWVLRLPAETKAGERKAFLVEAVRDVLPPEILGRKQGFLLPISAWMRRELRDQVSETLDSPPSAVAELLDPTVVSTVWRDFESGRGSWLRPWALYSLCRWAVSLTPAGRRG
jgi:asparagine synthase (glutamine-hydrolysing)